MKSAYSYIRFSTPDQAKGDSFRRQSDKAAGWAAKNGYRIVDVLADLGVSGYRGKNTKTGRLGAFLALVEAGKITRGSVLIVESLDRFSRNTVREVLPDFLNVINAGVGVVTLTDERLYTIDSLDADNLQLIGSLMVMIRAHEESVRKGGNVAAAWAKKRARARENSEGLTDRVPAWLDVVSKQVDGRKIRRFVPNKVRVKIVQRVFRETTQGYGRRAIAKHLNEEGRPAFRSKKGWQPSYIAKLIRGRAVLGEYLPHKRNAKGVRVKDQDGVIKNYYPAVIDEALWLKANRATTKRANAKIAGRPQPDAANLIPALARCTCGARMAHLNKGEPPKGGRYYACSSALREAGCSTARHWNRAIVEEALFYQLDKAALERFFEPQAEAPMPASEEDYEERIKDLRRQLANAFKYLVKDTTEDPTLTKEVNDLREQIASIEEEQNLAVETVTARPDLPSTREAWAAALTFRDRLKNANGAELIDLRQKMLLQLRTILSEVRFSRDSIHVAIEISRKPSAKMMSAWLGTAWTETKTVDKIERHYLLKMIYTEDVRFTRRVGAPRGGIFISSFAKSA